ncbi:hypothetical protein XH90_31430 [Bradyrhizobium sp. CCBAU 53338]|nr:hypothetical protein XH90_31430 [Bradyrhizobium sp. CCBAU 53338]
MLRQILFKCPRTGTNVQLRLDDAGPECSESTDTHVSVLCPACASLHFVNSTTGRLLGDRARMVAHSGTAPPR